jgi:CHAP domain
MLARERALEIALAEAARHVHEEGGANTGPRVREYQSATSLGGTGWAWCDAFCDYCFAQAGRPLEELKRSAGVELSYELARGKGWLVEQPARGDLVCFQWDSGPLDHIGFVLQPQPDGSVKTVEGNTSAMPGEGVAQGEGDGVFVKIRPRTVCAAFIRVPGDVADPAPKAGFDDWATWVKGGRKGKRPAVPEKIPAAWWAKLGEELHPKHHADPPHPAHAPQPAHA